MLCVWLGTVNKHIYWCLLWDAEPVDQVLYTSPQAVTKSGMGGGGVSGSDTKLTPPHRVNLFSARIDIRRQNLTSKVDPRTERINTIIMSVYP